MNVFLLLCLPLVSHAVLKGTETKWSMYPYVVKVFARAPNISTTACTGTLISPKLVLTSADCVHSNTVKLDEVVVVLSTDGGDRVLRKKADLVETLQTLAVVRLRTAAPLSQLCLPQGSGMQLSDLLVRPTLAGSPIEKFDKSLLEATCRVVGFTTSRRPEGFISMKNVSLAHVKVKEEHADFVSVVRSSTDEVTPCYEDAGLPLECSSDGDKWVQMGVLTTLFSGVDVLNRQKRDTNETEVRVGSVGEKVEEKIEKVAEKAPMTEEERMDRLYNEQMRQCVSASSMQFTRVEPLQMAALIEQYDLAEFASLFYLCRNKH